MGWTSSIEERGKKSTWLKVLVTPSHSMHEGQVDRVVEDTEGLGREEGDAGRAADTFGGGDSTLGTDY